MQTYKKICQQKYIFLNKKFKKIIFLKFFLVAEFKTNDYK